MLIMSNFTRFAQVLACAGAESAQIMECKGASCLLANNIHCSGMRSIGFLYIKGSKP